MDEFKVGDVVQLKCGGQQMVVREILPAEAEDTEVAVKQAKPQPAGTVRCQWNAGGRPYDVCYPPEMLRRGDEGGPVEVQYVDVMRLPARDVGAEE